MRTGEWVPYIDIEEGEEYNLRISENINSKNDLMYSAYRDALSALKGIMERSHAWYNQNAEKSGSPYGGRGSAPVGMEFYGYANNIISFCAGRGQGKTSAMLSFTNALSRQTYANRILDGKMGSDRFFVLPPIDMALLNEKDSVMESVLSSLLYYSDQQSNELSQSSSSSKRLFNQDNNFRRWNDFSSGRSSSEQDKIALFQEFKKCLSEVRTLQSKVRSNKSLDSMSVDLDSLYQLGNSFDLKGDFYKSFQK